MTRSPRWILNGIMALALAGAAVSSVSLYHHYDKTESSFCDFGGKFNCDIVNRSIYSAVFDIPVALIGIVGYLALAVLAQISRTKSKGKTFLLLASLAELAFALRLTYIEGFVLAAWCVLCLTSLALIFFITILAITFAVRSNQSI
jgi:uncharacterized membrane protein